MSRRRRRSWSLALGLSISLAGLDAMPARGQTEAESLSASFRKAARRTLPAVVSIRPLALSVPFGPVPPFANIPIVPPLALPGRPTAGGSGVVIDAGRGLVLTNDHVLGDGSPVVVVLGDGRERPVVRADRDPKSDLALLTVADPSGLAQAEWGDSDATDIGDWVLAIGQPFGLSGTVTAGIVSGKGRGVGVALYEDLIQTDASINPGNSGGPLVNLRGEIVGINTAIKTAGGGYEGVGFAVPAARARRVATDLAASGRVRRAYLGINIRRVDVRTAERIGRSDAAMIFGVVAGSPADQAGLRPGDVITGLGGRPIDGTGPLQTAIEIAAVGEPLSLAIDRDGQTREVAVRPAAQPDRFGLPGTRPVLPPAAIEPRPRAGDDEPPLNLAPSPTTRIIPAPPPVGPRSMAFADLGLTVAESGTGGLVVEQVAPDGPADRGGLEAGMKITEVDGRPIASIDELRAAESRRAHGGDVRIGISRGSKSGVRVIPRPTGGSRDVLEPIPAPAPPPTLAPSLDLPTSAPATAPRRGS